MSGLLSRSPRISSSASRSLPAGISAAVCRNSSLTSCSKLSIPKEQVYLHSILLGFRRSWLSPLICSIINCCSISSIFFGQSCGTYSREQESLFQLLENHILRDMSNFILFILINYSLHQFKLIFIHFPETIYLKFTSIIYYY